MESHEKNPWRRVRVCGLRSECLSWPGFLHAPFRFPNITFAPSVPKPVTDRGSIPSSPRKSLWKTSKYGIHSSIAQFSHGQKV